MIICKMTALTIQIDWWLLYFLNAKDISAAAKMLKFTCPLSSKIYIKIMPPHKAFVF